MILFERVSKFFPTKQGRFYVLNDVSIELPTDRNIAVLGPNGAGKSTLIRLMGGAALPNRGKILSDCNISWPLGLQAGLQGSMTGRENVRFVARVHGISNTSIIEREVQSFSEIGRYFDEPVKNYSSGMRSRVSFGLTMAFDFNFDVLLIDELTAVGDVRFRKKCHSLLLEKYKTTKVIMVNHSFKELRKHCDSGLVVHDKNLVFFEELEDAIESYQRNYE